MWFIGILQGLEPVSLRLDDYCDSKILQNLPFPFIRVVLSDRFPLDAHDRFRFCGRQQFRGIYNAAQSLNYRGTRMYYLVLGSAN